MSGKNGRGTTLVALINQRIQVHYSIGVANYADNLQNRLKDYVNGRVDLFLHDLGKEVIGKYTENNQPSFLKAAGVKPWKPISDAHFLKKKHLKMFLETGSLKSELSALTAPKQVRKLFGGYYLKRSNPNDTAFQPLPSSGILKKEDLPKGARGFPTKRESPEFLFRPVHLGEFQFSVMRTLADRKYPELLLDKIVPPTSRVFNRRGGVENIPVSLKLGYYSEKRRYVDFYRPILLPYARYWVLNKLIPDTQRWLQREAVREARK